MTAPDRGALGSTGTGLLVVVAAEISGYGTESDGGLFLGSDG